MAVRDLIDCVSAAGKPSRLEHLQTTAVAYLNELRISWAKRLLSTTEKTCLEICYESGFENLSYFNRTFKKLTGLTPSQFRKQHRPAASISPRG